MTPGALGFDYHPLCQSLPSALSTSSLERLLWKLLWAELRVNQL